MDSNVSPRVQEFRALATHPTEVPSFPPCGRHRNSLTGSVLLCRTCTS